MKNKSIWQEYKMKYSYPKLTKDIKVDIYIGKDEKNDKY